ncbi:MAG: MFS transporter, partial [Atopobiaceae bacterium]
MSKKGTAPMLVVLFCAAFISAFNENIINVGLADVMTSFSIDTVTANWLVTGYMIVVAVIVTVVGFLLKRLRLRQLFFLGSGVFVVGSAGALLAPTFPVLLVCRLVQALGTGIFTPTMMNTVLLVSPRERIGTNLAIGSCCITFGPAFAPVVSGLAVNLLGWRGIFAFPLVAMVALAVVGIPVVRDVGEQVEARLDVASVALSAVGLTALVYGISEVTSALGLAIASMGAGLAFIACFVVRQRRVESPLMNLEPMRKPLFAVACLLVAITMMVTFSMSVLLPLYFEGSLGCDAFLAGLLVLVPILAQALGSLVGGRAMDWQGEWPLLPIGFAVT